VFEVIDALKKSPTKPKADDPAPTALLLAVRRLDAKSRWKGVELRATGATTAASGQTRRRAEELAAWGRWFGQTFPKEPALPT
jgi:hypothetical protein